MKHIYLNLKRFDISPELGGVNRLAPIGLWGKNIVESTDEALKAYSEKEVEFVMYMPEAHLISACEARSEGSHIKIGSQSVYRADTEVGGNFGAFTTNKTGNAVAQMGCASTLIGHCEERSDKAEVLAETGIVDTKAINRLLNKEIIAAQKAGLNVLYCIGEKSEEQDGWQEVLGEQLEIGLKGVNLNNIAIAYEPIWSIGPGKTPADREYIQMVAKFIKEKIGNVPVVYGGGLKQDNAKMLAGIPEIDGGLIALTRFQGEIGFYPEEYLEIIKLYMEEA